MGLFLHIEKVLDLWVQLMKKGGKNKSDEFIILFVHNAYQLGKKEKKCVCVCTLKLLDA